MFYQCKECDRLYRTEEYLQYHKSEECTGEAVEEITYE